VVDERAVIRFTGRLAPASFTSFARHRAARLSLRLDAWQVDKHQARAVLHGPPDLLDAFEMACALGPLDCIVLHVMRGE